MLMATMLAAMNVLGTIIAFVASLSNAFSFDAISQAQGSVISTFFVNLAMVLIFITDMHHVMISAVVDSYSLFIPGALPPIGNFAEFMTRTVAGSFKIGVQLAAPFFLLSFAKFVSRDLINQEIQED